jgi:hypothetical protein
VEQFVKSKNADRYRHLLERVHDDGSVPEKTWRQTIYGLLAEEQRKQKDRAIKFVGLVGKLIRSPPY